ncbi:MAG: 2-oxoacid:acceptor oxidoreductase family protein [Chloroflexota bacterium]|nr:2-oxoacid:acceptor oxidoreductase family protein [Chloroflexota bacterium]
MKEIRIHGRGGQGSVAAAELLALAAFEDKYEVQAFPAFGAERMGAPVQAFVRIAAEPIRRRSQVYKPDAVIVQDCTLLRTVDVLAGLRPGGHLILNAESMPEHFAAPAAVRVWLVPGTQIALDIIGRPIPNAVLLGAFAAITEWVTLAALSQAIRSRFRADVAERNVKAALQGFVRVTRSSGGSRGRRPRTHTPISRNGDRPSLTALQPGTSRGYLTGGWRTLVPHFVQQKCNSCDLCVVYCPEGIVRAESKNRYVADLDFCKGCGICAEECPVKDIEMVAEESA